MEDDDPIVKRGSVEVHTSTPDGYGRDRKFGRQTIPMARADGTSRGFNHMEPGVVIVDPDDNGSSVQVDFGKLRPKDLAGMGSIPEGHTDIVRRMQDLAQAQQARMAHPPQPAPAPPVQGPAPMQPAAIPTPVLAATPLVAPAPQAVTLQSIPQAPQTAAVAPMPTWPAPQPDPLTMQLAGILQGVQGALGQLSQRMDHFETNRAAEVLAPVPVAAAPPLVATQAPEPESEAPSNPLPIDVNKPPVKPQHQVFFKLPGGIATLAGKYHHVSVQEDTIVLYFDTRYDGATQVALGANDAPVGLHIPSVNVKVQAVYQGLSDSFGPIDWELYIIVKDQEPT